LTKKKKKLRFLITLGKTGPVKHDTITRLKYPQDIVSKIQQRSQVFSLKMFLPPREDRRITILKEVEDM